MHDSVLREFLQGQKIAIFGLSPDCSKPSHHVGEYLKNAGYTLFPIYPKGEEILGFAVYRSLQDLPCVVDVLVIFRKPEAVESVVREALQTQCTKRIWVQEGIVSEPARNLCLQAGIPYVQNLCIAIEHERLA